MEIKVKVKPRMVRASSREALMNLILGGHIYSWQSNASAYKPMFKSKNKDEVRVFNLHKINAKYRQIKYKASNPKTGAVKGRTRKTELVRRGEWIAYIYDIDLALLKAAGLHIRQGNRNFVIAEIKKG